MITLRSMLHILMHIANQFAKFMIAMMEIFTKFNYFFIYLLIKQKKAAFAEWMKDLRF